MGQNRINQLQRQQAIQSQQRNQLAWQNSKPYANHAAIWNAQRNLANSQRNKQRMINQERRNQNQLAWQSQQLSRQGMWGNGYGNNPLGNLFFGR